MLMLSYKIVGGHLRNARERLALSQQEVATKADISIAYYGKIERGDIRPNLDRLSSVCDVLELPISDVFKGARIDDGELTNREPDATEFIDFFREIAARTSLERRRLIMQVSKNIADFKTI